VHQIDDLTCDIAKVQDPPHASSKMRFSMICHTFLELNDWLLLVTFDIYTSQMEIGLDLIRPDPTEF